MKKNTQVGRPLIPVPEYLDEDQNPTNEELNGIETKAKKKVAAKKDTKTTKAGKKKAAKAADAPKRGSKKKTTKKASKNGKPAHKGGHGEFASKLEGNVGREIEKRFVNGEGLSTIAKSMGVSTGTVRFHFLQYLIKELYTFEKAE